MKALRIIWVVTVVLALSLAAAAQESLADKARAAKAQKSATPQTKRVFTNDSIGADTKPEPSGTAAKATASGDATGAATGDAAGADAAKTDAPKTEAAGDKSSENDKKAAEEWKAKIEKAVADIALLERELTVSDRENHLRAAAFYGDAGTRLRDEAKYAEEDRKYQAEVEAKKKAIADAKAALEKMRDDARKAGVPSNLIP